MPSVALRCIAGFCAVSKTLPLPASVETETGRLWPLEGNGMNAAFDQTVHCIAAEPEATFIRVSAHDGNRQEVAYETANSMSTRPAYATHAYTHTNGIPVSHTYRGVRHVWSSDTKETVVVAMDAAANSHRGRLATSVVTYADTRTTATALNA